MWFYAKDNKQEGPVGADVIRQLHSNGELSNSSLIWKEGMGQWTPLGQVPEFSTGNSPALTAPAGTGLASEPQPSAGASLPAQPAPGLVAPPQQNGLALASMILGICSFVVCGGAMTGIAAIICGHIAKKQLRESRHMQTGDGMATAGLIMGYLATVFTVLFIVFYIVAIAAAVSTGGMP